MKKTAILFSLLFLPLIASCNLNPINPEDDHVVNPDKDNKKSYTITNINILPESGGKFTIDPSKMTGKVGDDVYFLIEINDGYSLEYIKINDNLIDKNSNSFKPIEGSNTIEVSFYKNGSVDPKPTPDEGEGETKPDNPNKPDGGDTNPDNPNKPDGGETKPDNPDGGETKPDNPDGGETKPISNNVTIYCLNDTHGDLLRDPDIDSYGIDGISYKMKEEAINNNYVNPSFICTGDMFQGQYVSNTTRGRVLVDALNYMNLEAFILGNHEFDWGLEQIHKYKDGNLENGELNCDILCANLIEKRTGKTPSWLKPYTILENNGHKVGLLGFMGENLESSILHENIKDYEFVPSYDLVVNYTKELRNKGCDTVILGIHDYDIDLFKKLALVPNGVDGIFGGHTHRYDFDSLPTSDGRNIYSVQAKCNNEAYSVMNFTYKDNKVDTRECHVTDNTYIGTDLDYNLKNMIEEKYASTIRDGNEVLATNFGQKNRYQWGNYVVQSLVGSKSNGAQGSIINTGGIRASTNYTNQSSTLYMKQLFRVLPFDNKIYQVKMKFSDFLRIANDTHYYSKYIGQPNSEDIILVNIIDFVFDGAYFRDIFNVCEKVYTFPLNIRNYVASAIRGEKA